MPRLRLLHLFITAVIVFVALFAVSGRGQTPPPRRAHSEPGRASGDPARHQSGHLARARHAGDAQTPVGPSGLMRVVDRTGASGARYRAGPRDRQVQRRRVGGLARLRALGRVRHGPRCRRGPPARTSTSCRSIRPPTPRPWRGRSEAARRCEYAQAAYRVHAQLVPNDEFYPDQWNLPDDQHGDGLGHSAGRRLRDHRRGPRYRRRVHVGDGAVQRRRVLDSMRRKRRPARQSAARPIRPWAT